MSHSEALIPGGELREVHSYLMRAALSTSLPVQLTRLHLAKTNQVGPNVVLDITVHPCQMGRD